MKRVRTKYFWFLTTILLGVGYFISCTKDNQVLDTATTNSGTDLLSYKTTTAPVIDGTIDAIWDNATKLDITPTVPDPGNGLFNGYSGEEYPVTLRSMYDNDNVYFLAEYADDSKSTNVQPWYFNPVTQRWAQEDNKRAYDSSGRLTREGWGEDKIAMLWNIGFSTTKFPAQTCYSSCHVFTPYMDYSTTPPVYKSNAASGNHYTNGVNEKIDMWWGYLGRGVLFNQMDDNYQDWAGGPAITNLTGGNANGRHVDGVIVNGASSVWPNRPTYSTTPPQGGSNNRQTLKLDGTGANVNVPMWIIPGATNYDHILATDTANGTAKKVTAISSTGVLTYDGGVIDPNDPAVAPGYVRSGDPVYGDVGPKAMPGYIASPLLGERDNIMCSAVYTGTGWVVEYKRALKTNDVLKQDIDFTYQKDDATGQLQDQPFGFAVWNRSNYQHAIQPNLVLKFQK